MIGGGLAAAIPSSLLAAARRDRFLEAAIFAFPAVELARLAANAPGPRNVLNHRRTLSDHRSRGVTMPNNDTLYSAAWLDLASGPVDLDVPLDSGRYLSVALMNAFTDNVAVISRRSHRGRIARLRVVGPSKTASSPNDRTVIRMPTDDGWLIARTYVEGPSKSDRSRGSGPSRPGFPGQARRSGKLLEHGQSHIRPDRSQSSAGHACATIPRHRIVCQR
jgi:hypothetical protein